MNALEFKAMISLLDDSDSEVINEIRSRIINWGLEAVPHLEKEWEFYGENPLVQEKIEDLIQDLHFGNLFKNFEKWISEGGRDLLEGLWLISRINYPESDIQWMRVEINNIFMEIWVNTHEDMHPADFLKILNDILFNKLGFRPNVKNFHSPANSMFNQVLENRRGNPVSLSCVYILLAEKLGIPLFGVNLPFLFVTVLNHPDYRYYVNPFNKGQTFVKKDIEEYLKQIKIESKPEYFEPCTNTDIIKRILTNLSYAYHKKGDLIHLNQVSRIIDMINSF